MKSSITHFFRIAIYFLWIVLPFYVSAEKKVALIIGNQNYSDQQFDNLPTCINDAHKMKDVLSLLGFSTIVLTDGDKTEMVKAFNEFLNLSKGADVAVYFFSGHATRLGEDLYLVPSKTEFQPAALNEQFVSLSSIREHMENNSTLSFIFLDACRDKGYTRTGSHKGRRTPNNVGKNNSTVAHGCMICYATENGRTASLGIGSLSPFTQVLSSHLLYGEEFRTIWYYIKNEVPNIEPGQYPQEEGSYTNSYFFNPNGKKLSAPTISNNNGNNKRIITITTNVPNGKFNFYGTKYDSGTQLLFEIGRNYVFSAEAPGYQTYIGKLEVTTDTPESFCVNLIKETASYNVSCNRKANVYFDGKFVGVVYKNNPLSISTVLGTHSIKLTSNKCSPYNIDVDLAPGINSKYFWLSKDTPEYWDWDDYNDSQYFSYMYSPKYKIGLSYLYRPENSRFSYGAILSVSPEWFRGLKLVAINSYTTLSSTFTIDDKDGNMVEYQEVSTSTGKAPNKYTEEIDPNHEAKKYNANALMLVNVGFNPCNGILIEAGFGSAYHQDRYHLPFQLHQIKTVTTNLNTGETVGEPTYKYSKDSGSQWIKQNAKWSPALRSGAKALIPLDYWDKYFISLGGGYTFLFSNSKYSSWDANIGIVWKF